MPVSSANSRFAATSASSPASNSPFGIDQAPASLFFQKRSPRMDEENLDAAAAHAVDEDSGAGAGVGHGVRR
jgi:hypothetical protein